MCEQTAEKIAALGSKYSYELWYSALLATTIPNFHHINIYS